MLYNMVLCRLSLGEHQVAILLVQSMKVELEQSFYADFVNFRKWVTGEVPAFKKEEVFPNRNKLSNFLPPILLEAQGQTLSLRLCVPFPKVEPPEIFPVFDKALLERLSVLNVERKPEAPWILRETNSIRFTEKMEEFSRLQLEDS
jgi:hypothetical protein